MKWMQFIIVGGVVGYLSQEQEILNIPIRSVTFIEAVLSDWMIAFTLITSTLFH